MRPILGYWNLRGRANPIRLIFHNANVQFEEKHYSLDSNAIEWFKEKPTLGQTLDFPNVPYLIDGEFKISQTKAILSYLGRKFDLDVQTKKQRVQVDVAMEAFSDMLEWLINIAYPAYPALTSNRAEIHEQILSAYEKKIVGNSDEISKFLQGHKWVAGDRLTYADFYDYDILDMHLLLFGTDVFSMGSEVAEYMMRFEGLNGVKEFLASPPIPLMPIFTEFALFGNTKDFKPKQRELI